MTYRPRPGDGITVGDLVEHTADGETIRGTVKAIHRTARGPQFIIDVPGATGLAARGIGVYGPTKIGRTHRA